MSLFFVLSLIGLGTGAIIASLTIGLVVIYKGTGILNFAQGAVAMWGAYVYNGLTAQGRLVLPWAGVPNTIQFAAPVNRYVALAAGVASAALLGALIHLLVMRRMRGAPPLGQVVATIGVMLVIQGLAVHDFGTGTTSGVLEILPHRAVTIGDVSTSIDRLLLAGMAVAVTAMVWAWFRYTASGLACRAVADSEKGAMLSGLSPGRLSLITWTVSSALAGLFGVLVAPLVPISSDVYPLLVVPALAAALAGRLTRLWVATVAGLLIGCLEASVQFFLAKGWLPVWLQTGLPQAIPVVLIIVFLVVIGGRVGGRSSLAVTRLAPVRIPRRPGRWAIGLAGLGIAGLYVLNGNYRLGLLVSVAAMAITLSQVVLTGFVGQISFAQAAIAGTSAFALSKLTAGFAVPFPLGPLLAVTIATAFGTVIGLPALRVRGTQLAVVTIAGASAIEVLVFQNASLLTSQQLAPVTGPVLAGLDLSPYGHGYPRPVYGVAEILVVAVLFWLVAQLLRGSTGRHFLAVRSDEAAAATAGVNTTTVKAMAFALSSACAAVGGVLIAELQGSVSAGDFLVFVSLSYLAVSYIGGIGTVAGAVIGGLAVNNGLLTVALNRYVNFGNWYLLATGVFLVVSAIDNPEGIVIRAERLARWASRRRARGSEEKGVVVGAPVILSAIAEPVVHPDRVR
jgi:branched-chain amino acid transport system permease protein